MKPDDFDITSVTPPGTTATVDYVLEPFFNECSPWNINCQDGVTCNACNYNSNTHTTPVYKITGQLIIKSSTALPISVDEMNEPIAMELYPNPSIGELNIQLNRASKTAVLISDLNGRLVKRFTMNGRSHQADVSDLADGVYQVHLQNDEHSITKRLVLKSH